MQAHVILPYPWGSGAGRTELPEGGRLLGTFTGSKSPLLPNAFVPRGNEALCSVQPLSLRLHHYAKALEARAALISWVTAARPVVITVICLLKHQDSGKPG